MDVKNSEQCFSKLPVSDKNTELVYDAMAFVHANGKQKNETYAQLSERYFKRILHEVNNIGVREVHWVNDRYDIPLSPKVMEHQHRSGARGPTLGHHAAAGIAVPNWTDLMANQNSKASLLQFISEDWVKLKKSIAIRCEIVCCWCLLRQSKMAVCAENTGCNQIADLQSHQEEADS